MKVDDTSYKDFGIAVRPGHGLYPGQGYIDPTFEVSVPATEARRVKGSIAVIVTGHLRAPWIVTETSTSEATISEPYVFRYDKKFLTIEPEELIVFRTDTGAILGRFNEK